MGILYYNNPISVSTVNIYIKMITVCIVEIICP